MFGFWITSKGPFLVHSCPEKSRPVQFLFCNTGVACIACIAWCILITLCLHYDGIVITWVWWCLDVAWAPRDLGALTACLWALALRCVHVGKIPAPRPLSIASSRLPNHPNRLWSLPVQKLICSWNATDVLMVQCCSSLFLFEFALCEFSMRWWSFEITCPISYFQTSLDPSLACGQSVRPPSPIDPWTEPLQELSQAKCGSVSTISRKVPTDSLLCWRSFSSCVSRSSQDTAVPFSCWTKSSALSAASKKIKNNTNTNRKS